MLPPHHAWKYRTVSVSADSPAPPIAGWPSAPVHINTAPWLHPFIGDFCATTGRSAPSHRFPTMALAGPLLEPFGYHRCGRFPRSTLPPRTRVMPPSCRRPHVPETGLVHAYPGTTTPSRFRPHLVYVSTRHQWFTFVHLSVTYLIRSIAGPFPSVLTTVAFGHRRRRRFGTRSCQPVPRGLFFPHRLCSCATDEAHLFVRCSWRTAVLYLSDLNLARSASNGRCFTWPAEMREFSRSNLR